MHGQSSFFGFLLQTVRPYYDNAVLAERDAHTHPLSLDIKTYSSREWVWQQ